MQILKTPAELKQWRAAQGAKSVGFVPTMGALHQGHFTLFEKALAENDATLGSIFVNPTQFNNPEDLSKYPRTLEADLAELQKRGVAAVFTPQTADLYPDGYMYQIEEKQFSKTLCGADRPGHFEGVLTVVMKLLQLANPTHAYFGEKDFQQLTLIQGMVKAFFLDVQIVPVPTVREADGLAMSSRNVRLTAEERAIAPQFYAALSQSKTAEQAKQKLEQQGFKVDYVEDAKGRRFGAIQHGAVRLIDNAETK